MIYCWFIYSPSISPLPSPPHLHHCTEGRFFNFLHENNAIAFLASPAKQAPAAHGNRWPPIIAECLIDPGRAECSPCVRVFCVCLREREHMRGRLPFVMHVMRVPVPGECVPSQPTLMLACPLALGITGWMAFPPHLYTPTRHAGVIESLAGVSERWPRVSILLITIPPEFYDARSLTLSHRPWRGEKANERRMWRLGGCISCRVSCCGVITWLNDPQYLSLSVQCNLSAIRSVF